jgi:hypothetical protein
LEVDNYDNYLALKKASISVRRAGKRIRNARFGARTSIKNMMEGVVWSVSGCRNGIYIDQNTGEIVVMTGACPGTYFVTAATADGLYKSTGELVVR